MIDQRPIPRRGETMPVTREARYLSGVDIGKTVEGTDDAGRRFDGPLGMIAATDITIRLTVKGCFHSLRPRDAVTITGKAS